MIQPRSWELGGDAPGGPEADERTAVAAMLEARSVALVGASPRDGSLGQRMITEMARSSPAPRTYLVNPRHTEIAGTRCYASLADLPEAPVDLVLLAVPDTALEEQLALAARRGDRSAVIYGSAFDPPGPRPAGQPSLRDRLAATARAAGMAVCGAGCMGFVTVTRGLRAVGYVEPDPLPAGPVALVTHSGSVFSAMLRTRRGFGYTVAVSSGQELVTSAAEYAEWALGNEETRVLALVLEAVRDASRLRAVLAAAAARDIPVVLLSAGRSARGRAMVSAHSGALAAADGGWEALARGYGVHRVGDLAELADTLELFAAGRRVRGGTGIATVHDSGLERAHVADVADELGVPFAAIGGPTTARLAGLLDPGLEPANPLDIWGTGARAQEQLSGALTALAADPAVAAVALAVDLVHEYDGDQSYPDAVTEAARHTSKPVLVLSNLPAAIDPDVAARLRAGGIPVLEGTRTGLLALGHLLDHGRLDHGRLDHGRLDHGRLGHGRLGPGAGGRPGAASGPSIRAGGPAGPRCWPRARGAARCWPTCSATTGSPWPEPGPRSARRRHWRLRPSSATRWCSRPTSPGSRTSRTWAGWCSGWPARPRWPRPTRTWPSGWAAGCWFARPSRPGRSCPWAWPGTTSWARCWWWARAGCWSNCSPTGPSRCPRSGRSRPRRWWASSGWRRCWPARAASPRPTWPRSGPPSPGCPSSPSNWVTYWKRWTSTR